MASLYLVRHPRPSAAERLCYGRHDVGVSEESVAEAAARARAALPDSLLRTAEIYTSPARRCAALARELAAPRTALTVPALREMGFGAWEGLPWDEVPRAELDAWAADVWNYRTGGDESAHMVRERWERFLAALEESPNGARDAIAVTHSGVIRVALAGAGLLGPGEFLNASIEYGSVHVIELHAGQAA